MPTELERELARIQQAHHARMLAIRQTAGGLIEDAWDAYADLDASSAARFVEEAARIAVAAQEQTGSLAVAYMEANDALVDEAADLAVDLVPIRNGVPPEQVYERSIIQARQMVADGADVLQALQAGRSRAVSTVQTDVIATNRATIARSGPARPWVVGYRRVLTGKSCALCATASTQRYHRADLAPIHPRCDCDIGEIIGTADPGRIVNRELLDDLKAEGVPDDITRQRQVRELTKTRNRQQARVDELTAEMRAETDQDRETRLERPIDKERQKVAATERKIERAREDRRAAAAAGGNRPASFYVDERGNILDRNGATVRVSSRTHGELGETLTDRRHAFTAADDIADVELPRTPPRAPAGAPDPRADLDEIPAKVRAEAPPARIKPTDPESPKVIAEARRRNVSPEQVAGELDAKALRRAQERARSREYEAALTVDHPDVIRVAERYGVAPDAVMMARARVPEVRGWLRDEAAQVQQEQFRRLYLWNDVKMRGPGAYKGTPPAEYDWFRGLDDREKSRLSRQWFSADAPGPDVLAEQIAGADAALGSAEFSEIIDEWLDVNRRYEMAGALRRGKLPSSRAYSDALDVDALLPDLSSRGISATRLLTVDDLEAAAHIAQADAGYLREEALQLLGDAARAQRGPAPYRMSFQAWEEEVRELDYGLRNYPDEMPRWAGERLDELVPRFVDEPGLGFEELYARIVTTAQTAGEEVPDYARIPWQ